MAKIGQNLQPAMVMSPYKWKILKGRKTRNKQKVYIAMAFCCSNVESNACFPVCMQHFTCMEVIFYP